MGTSNEKLPVILALLSVIMFYFYVRYRESDPEHYRKHRQEWVKHSIIPKDRAKIPVTTIYGKGQ